MDYYNKYIKYKTKYYNMIGGNKNYGLALYNFDKNDFNYSINLYFNVLLYRNKFLQ